MPSDFFFKQKTAYEIGNWIWSFCITTITSHTSVLGGLQRRGYKVHQLADHRTNAGAFFAEPFLEFGLRFELSYLNAVDVGTSPSRRPSASGLRFAAVLRTA